MADQRHEETGEPPDDEAARCWIGMLEAASSAIDALHGLSTETPEESEARAARHRQAAADFDKHYMRFQQLRNEGF